MKNKWRFLKIFVTVGLLGFLLSFSLKRFSQKTLETIEVNLKQTPVYFVDEKDIRETVKKQNPSQKVGDLDIPALEKKLNNLAAVDSANVYLSLNGTLHIDIKQNVPVFRLTKGEKVFYVNEKGVEFPISKNYSHPCMLVYGKVRQNEYKDLVALVEKINEDQFCKKYFVGITKENGSYYLLTSEGDFRVEIGDLQHIDFKINGFKTFVEKYLVFQDPQKYSKISLKYNNQVVTTLNPYFKENDSIINAGKAEIEKTFSEKKQ